MGGEEGRELGEGADGSEFNDAVEVRAEGRGGNFGPFEERLLSDTVSEAGDEGMLVEVGMLDGTDSNEPS